MKTYLDIVHKVLNQGIRKENRTGIDTLSLFNYNYEIDLSLGFPLLTTKEVSWKNIVVELLWFLSGEKNIRLLHKHGCYFWDSWANKNQEVPSAYGFFWRQFHSTQENYNDQISFVINEIKKNPFSRRLVVSAWEPNNSQSSQLPPCHCLYVFNVQNNAKGHKTLNLHLTQRSCDIALGLPYNIASYSLLLHLLSHIVNIPVGKFAHTLVDAHIYTSKEDFSMQEYDHVPHLKKQLLRTPHVLPKLTISNSIRSIDDIENLLDVRNTKKLLDFFHLKNYSPHPAIPFKVAV